jgi:predicted Ser/Thr protein kinase
MAAPTRLGKYELRRELGKGSMGVVYEAFDTVIERPVAIKIIRQDEFGVAHTSELAAELITRLRREAQAAGRLNHPGIVSVYDFGEDATVGGGGIAYIAMELVEGRELKELLDGGRRFTPAETVRMLGEVLGALQHAHDRGVTHRDIKPGNVILLADGGVKLADFGIARIERSELTQAGTLIGTPMYMSPEQILGLPVDGRSDLFSCGVLLYELLTGRKPFTGSVTTVIQQVLNVEPEPPSRANARLGTDWDHLLQRALAKKPEDRFASARDMAQALRESLARHQDDGTVVMAAPLPSVQGASVVPAPTVRPATPVDATARPSRRGGVALAAGVIALSGAAGLFMLLRPTARQGPDTQVAGAAAVSGSAAPALAPAPAPALAPAPAPALAPAPAPASASAPAPASATATTPAQAPAPVAGPGPGPIMAPVPATLPTAPPASASATPAPAPASVAAAPPRAQEVASRPAAGPAPRPAAVPAPAPAPRPVAVPATPPASPTRTPAATPASAPASEWPARLARVDKLKADITLTQALRRLFEPMPPSDRQTMAEFEALMRQQSPTVGLAMGIKNGYFHYWWVRGAKDAAAAAAAARSRCQERHGTTCHTVLVGGALQPDGFAAASRALGSQPPDAVRTALLQAFALSIVTARQAQAASAPGGPVAAPAPSPPAAASEPRLLPRPSGAAPPSAGSVPTAPAAGGWPTARAKLRGPAAPQDLPGALAVLLQVDNPADLAVLARLHGFTRRQPWNSALAMGIRNGFISWHGSSGEKRAEWAREQALSRCAASAQPCVIVVANGEPQLDAVRELAARLGARPQAEVREALLNNLRRHLP